MEEELGLNPKELAGGPGGVRTLDLMTASHARSQLRHRPLAILLFLMVSTPTRPLSTNTPSVGRAEARHLDYRSTAARLDSRTWPPLR
jgi:hypothetical protein